MASQINKNCTIVLPILENKYDSFLNDPKIARQIISEIWATSPELFPAQMTKGYVLNGKTRPSKKMNIQMRKIKVAGQNYQIRPSFILPYCRAKTYIASKGLFLKRFGVPFWALAFAFGYNAMWWYRLYNCFSDYSIVGTTIHDPEKLPSDILADEHHVKIQGKKAYVATTVGQNCFLGMEVSSGADADSLEEAYGVFKQEAEDVSSDYQPNTVNTDGWTATQNAWQKLYPNIQVIECFLHAFLKIRDRATKKIQDYFNTAADKVWEAYRTTSKRQFAQHIRRLREWTAKNVPSCPMKDNILKLCKKKNKWLAHFDFPKAHKTSNMIDRSMRAMNRHANNSQMFHGDILSTTHNFRAFALLHNFSPSCLQAWDESAVLISPAARLNGFVYHHDWLQNLLIAASLGGYRNHSNPL
jgi:hypothetical protein